MTQKRAKAQQEIKKDRKKIVIFFHDVRNISKRIIIVTTISWGLVGRTDPPSKTDIAVIFYQC
jgi:hypothetical protein